jgi:phenylacetate-CoA ligase
MTSKLGRAGTYVHYARALRQVLHDGKLDRPELERLVHRRLRKVLVSAYRHVPFYRELMRGVGYDPTRDYRGPQDLERLPITTKSTIRERGVQTMVREGSDLTKCYTEDSSGTTASPLRIYRSTYERSLEIAKWLRVLFDNGYSMRDRVMSVSTPSEAAHGHSAVQRLGLLRRQAINFREYTVEEMVDILLEDRPDVLYGTRCHLVLMALELRNRGGKCKGLQILAGTGEVMNQSHRTLFRSEFGSELVESYGSVEMGVMAYDSPQQEGLRLCEDLTYYEFLDEDGCPVAPGVPGRVIVTDLIGTLMPFIRYDQGDLAVHQQVAKGTGSTVRSVTQIMGRDCDFFRLADGTLEPKMQGTVPIRSYDRIVQYQFVQRTHTHIDVFLVVDSSYLDAIRGELLRELQSAFPADVRFELIQVERIEPDSSGKVHPVVSDVASTGLEAFL